MFEEEDQNIKCLQYLQLSRGNEVFWWTQGVTLNNDKGDRLPFTHSDIHAFYKAETFRMVLSKVYNKMDRNDGKSFQNRANIYPLQRSIRTEHK